MCMLMLVFELHISSFYFTESGKCTFSTQHLHRSFHVRVLQHDAASSFTETELWVTAVTPHDEEHLLYESRAVISTDDSVCVFAVEGAIFIRRNSVGTPEGEMFHSLWHRTSVILSQRRRGRQVYQVGGSGLSLCLPLDILASEMTDGQLCPTAVPPVARWHIYFLQGQTRRND